MNLQEESISTQGVLKRCRFLRSSCPRPPKTYPSKVSRMLLTGDLSENPGKGRPGGQEGTCGRTGIYAGPTAAVARLHITVTYNEYHQPEHTIRLVLERMHDPIFCWTLRKFITGS